MNVLPSRPLRLHKRFTIRSWLAAIVLSLGGAAICIAYTAWQLGDAQQIVRDEALWATGTAAADSDVSGTARSNYGIFKQYDLRVRYVDQTGGRHDRKASFSTLFGSVSEDNRPFVRYDATSPDRFALSWAHEVKGARWTSFVFMLVVGNLLGSCVALLGVLAWFHLRNMRRCVENPVELECVLLSALPEIINGSESGNIIYQYVLPELPVTEASPAAHYRQPSEQRPGTILALTVAIPKKRATPFYMDRAKSRILVLANPKAPTKPMVLWNDLYPLDVTLDERLDVQTRAESRESAREALAAQSA